ncbi:MAG: general secretion pathway protein GspK, partial [Planctomycetes bacterium]|nr:general secretion pathway protein GspK [Planctomycetota bacterium]
MVLSLGAYSFTEHMVLEREAAALYGRDVSVRAFADSGIEHAAALLGSRAELVTEENFYHAPDQFFAQMLVDRGTPRGRGGFTIVAPVESDATATSIRYGLIDESGKINLNAILKLGLDEEQLNYMLLALPDMTPEVADAILDYIDEDTTPRLYGWETEYNKNAPLDSIDELLNVPGVYEYPWLLLGEDANRNGLLDPGEDTSGDGILQLGWSAYFTVYSRESNRRVDGTQKLYLNENLLSDLYDQLAEEHGEEVATFVVAYRLGGPVETETDSGEAGGEGGGGGQVGSASTRGEGEAELQSLASGLARTIAGTGGEGGVVTRGGMDLTQGAQHQINSLFDLIGVQVEAVIDGATETLDSPWSDDSAQMASYLPQMMSDFTVVEGEFIEGRINVNQARYETLLAVPGMTEEVASAIVASKMIGSNGEPLSDVMGTHATTGWLVMDGLVDLPAMRKLDKYLTTRGDVFRAQVVGHWHQGGPGVRLEAVIDATQRPAKVLYVRDLTHLGRGYSNAQLVPLTAGGGF